nr:MAG TPA: hypothetical protein [Caudoviricetes sp.]
MMITNKRCGVIGSIPSTAGQWCKSIPLNYYFLNLKLIEENGNIIILYSRNLGLYT